MIHPIIIEMGELDVQKYIPFQMYQFKGKRELLPQHARSVERLDPIHFRKMLWERQ